MTIDIHADDYALTKNTSEEMLAQVQQDWKSQYPDAKFKLKLKDFSWHLEGSELDPSIVRLANASDGAKTEITAGEMLSIVGTNLALVNPGDETTVDMKLGDETQSFGPGAFEKQSPEQIVLSTAGDMSAGEWEVIVKRVASDGRAYISKPAKVQVKAG